MGFLSRLSALTLLLGVVGAPTASAQITFATVGGVMTDDTGGALSGVEVAVKNLGTGLTQSAVTTTSGTYAISGLPPGIYDVRAALAGFATAVQSGIQLTMAQEASLNLTMKVGMSELVVIAGKAALVETRTSTPTRSRGLPSTGTRLFPHTVTIAAGGTVNFVIAGLHQIAIYTDGVQPSDIDVALSAADAPQLIDDPAGRIYRGLNPFPLRTPITTAAGIQHVVARDRTEAVHFPKGRTRQLGLSTCTTLGRTFNSRRNQACTQQETRDLPSAHWQLSSRYFTSGEQRSLGKKLRFGPPDMRRLSALTDLTNISV